MPSVETLSAINFDEPEQQVAPSATGPRAPAGRSPLAISFDFGPPRLKRAELVQLSSQLSVMFETGVMISEALECIAEQADKPNVKSIVEELAAAVGRGEDFSTAVGRHPRSFP